MLAAEWGTGQVLWTMLYFVLFFIWIWMLVAVFGDIFRSADLSGWGKAAWCLFVIVLPYLGVFVYLIARGRQMQERAMDDANRRDEMFRGYVRDVVASSPPSSVDQLTTLASMRDQGVIDQAEFERMKASLSAA